MLDHAEFLPLSNNDTHMKMPEIFQSHLPINSACTLKISGILWLSQEPANKSKNWTPKTTAVIILKFEQCGFISERCRWNGKQCRP